MRKCVFFCWFWSKHSCFSMLTFKVWRIPVPTHFHQKQAKPFSFLTFAFLRSSFLVPFFCDFYNLSYFTMFAEALVRDLSYFTMFYRCVFGLNIDPPTVKKRPRNDPREKRYQNPNFTRCDSRFARHTFIFGTLHFKLDYLHSIQPSGLREAIK